MFNIIMTRAPRTYTPAINGARIPVTFPVFSIIPPRITTATIPEVTRPVIHRAIPKIRLHRVSNGVSLNGITREECSDPQENREGDCQRFPFGTQSLFYVIHGPAGDRTFPLVSLTVMDIPEVLSQGNLGKLGGHTNACRHPHPEKRARVHPSESPAQRQQYSLYRRWLKGQLLVAWKWETSPGSFGSSYFPEATPTPCPNLLSWIKPSLMVMEKACADQCDNDDGDVLVTYRDAGTPKQGS